ncbi:anthranilate synthase component II [Thermotomaculum hydrothermale]|uniref:Anthranilate synthase component II n=1 Tax=Thermotomaculum hydrothermale TaxID=981385 RepID=A0A7R6PN87_9BACT|nr:aminodeoxychorismate/anthranilate synthase component II [Thermotomaculum hydrothermale]BBB33187.1 anthranilate synthase component II [Thermotomaculum hydrothermale]
MKRIFLLDNFDSFTMNVYHLFSNFTNKIEVERADKTSIDLINKYNPDLLIISPGPGKPEDAKLSIEAIDFFKGKIPLFGICLGMQCMAVWDRGKVNKTKPIHGKTDLITHKKQGILKNIPAPFKVARYHSLYVANPGKNFKVIARNREGIPMAITHTRYKIFGVQFHPESFLTEFGLRIAENVLSFCD